MSFGKLRKYSELVVLSHSVFALPFALAAFVLAARGEPGSSPMLISYVEFSLVIVAVIAARTAAMAFNRLVDARVDALNPRTKTRHLPMGTLSKRSVWELVLVSSVLFFLCAGMLGLHCLIVAPFVLMVLLGYSYAKRFTHYSHLALGLALALAPGGAWWVLRPEVTLTPMLLMVSVGLWVAGFDILYSCQDVSVDKKLLLHSVPAKFGVVGALRISTAVHVIALFGFVLIGVAAALPRVYYLGVSLLGVLLIGQHYLVSERDLSKVNRAFFTFNGFVSVGYFLVVLLSVATK